MKRLLLGLVVITIMIFLYIYKSPIMSSGEAIIKAEEILQNPPKEWRNTISYLDLKEIQMDNINVFLYPKNGLLNELTNRKQWEVRIEYNGIEPTVVIDAHTGSLINIYGPMN
ncbi:hypothetical protein ACIQ1H_13985 [Lysinibacillus sp. NPDC097279]|uniref:hypothetical protein n=1 Tax=Lysinibacillus sp. NPDC097279 TaxID=3364143 RepID=UPI0037F80B37